VKSFDTWLNRFCRKHPNFCLPNLMMYVVIGNVLVFLMDRFSGGTFSNMLYFNRDAIFSGEVWRLLTFVFVPMDSRLFFLAISLYFYYFIGSALERNWGSQRFTVFYCMGIVLNILVGLIAGGTSMHYVNLSMFLSFATLYPDLQVLLFFVIPVKVKWIAYVDAAYFVLDVVRFLIGGHPLYALIPVVAILNYILFFWGDFRYVFQRTKRQVNRKTIDFQSAQKTARENKGYLHKCAVCGRTDTDFPDLEFRYCSKCNGYYCYCMDHINNHVHIE